VKVVLDASVLLKWLLDDPETEPDTERATALVQSVTAGDSEMLQPFHWLAEVAAVLARLNPATATDDVLKLRAMEIPVSDEVGVLERACRLAIDTEQHLFDTLYHAVALESEDAVLITADERYLAKGRKYGSIVSLRNWVPAA
jgi:predicted nucleic acid-binding protein